MALVECKECGQAVSTKASSCPNCGAKAPKKTSIFTWLTLALIIAVVYAASQDTDSPSSRTAIGLDSESSSSLQNTQEIQSANQSNIGSQAIAGWRPVSKSQMSQIGGLPVRATLTQDSTGKAILFVFCGEGVMLTFPNRDGEEINTIAVDGSTLEIGQRIASMTTVSGVVTAFKKGKSVRIEGNQGSIFDFSLIGFTKARNQSC